MNLSKELKNYLDMNGNIITTESANRLGITNEQLRRYVTDNDLERVTHGVYMRPDDLVDLLYVMQLRHTSAIASHETALYYHELTDRDPIRYSITLPSGYNATNLKQKKFKVYFVKRELLEVGSTTMTSVFNHPIVIYNLERTICDCIRSRNRMDASEVNMALKKYVSRTDKNLSNLLSIAKQLRVEKLVSEYMEMLL